MHLKQMISISILIVLILFSYLSFYTVEEGEQALVLRLGKITLLKNGEADIIKPGPHFKIPIIDQVRIFTTRIQELSSSSLTVLTSLQTFLVVDYYAKWRIEDLPKFYKSTGGSVRWAEELLEQKINDGVRSVYGKHTSDQAISTYRDNMMESIREIVNKAAQDQGVNVIDVRIRKIALPDDVVASVFKRMAAERKQFASAKRAEGSEMAEGVRALADQRATVIKAEALTQSAVIRAEGERIAAQLYATAYGKNPKLYSLYRRLKAYTTFNDKKDILVLQPEGEFFKYYHGIKE